MFMEPEARRALPSRSWKRVTDFCGCATEEEAVGAMLTERPSADRGLAVYREGELTEGGLAANLSDGELPRLPENE